MNKKQNEHILKYDVDIAEIGYYLSDFAKEKTLKCKINKGELDRLNSILKTNELFNKTFDTKIISYEGKTAVVRIYIEVIQ